LFIVSALATGWAQQAQTPPPATGQAPPPPAVTPRPVPPETTALTAAIRLTDPAAKLAALEKIRTDFPQGSNHAVVDTQILSTLLTSFTDRLPAITEVFERIVARIPADAVPEARLSQTITPVNLVIAKKVLLDRSSELMTAALAALTPEAHAASMRATAARLKQPDPPADRIQSSYSVVRARGLEVQARIANAKGDAAAAERLYKESVDASPAFGAAVTSLVDIYSARKEFDKAEAVLLASMKAALPVTSIATATVIASTPSIASRPTMALADLYEKMGDEAKLEALLRETLQKSPTTPGVHVKLAKLEARRGNDAAALDLFVGAAAQGSLAAADDGAMRALYRKAHNGSDAGLDDLIDLSYREKFPNPVKAEPYTPPAARTDRLVLLEMFTGSACGPCVSADLALDAVMDRYPAGTIVPVAYHQHIPGPDPMVTTGSQSRNTYYSVRGVPTFNIDGALGRLGGGARTNTAATYKDYISKIDKALLLPATAALTVSATGEGDRIAVTAEVTKLPADAKDLRLHLLLVERHLRFSGENGIRFHPMVVRGSAGEKGNGIPIASTGRTQHTFSLSEIRDDITSSLKADIERRRKTEAPGATPREYAADGRPYVAIDTSELVVVAFIQQGAYQAAAPTVAAATGIESVGDAIVQAPPASATPSRPAAAEPVANVLQAAVANVVFPSTRFGAGKGR
jgi:thiol-disulfide isomerase/thioredoxin/Tfp pilus assembly protein PilF